MTPISAATTTSTSPSTSALSPQLFTTTAHRTTTLPFEDLCFIANSFRPPVYKGDYSFNIGHAKHIESFEYAFIMAVLVIPICIGCSLAWLYQHWSSFDTFMLAGGSNSVLPVAVSLGTSYFTAHVLMWMPRSVYILSTGNIWDCAAAFLSISITGVLYLPILYQLRGASVFEYLEMRFNRILRLFGVAYYILHTATHVAVQYSVPCVVLERASKIDSVYSLVAGAVVVTLSVTLGGIRTVIWIEIVQFCAFVVGVTVVIIQSMRIVGSPAVVWRSLDHGHRLNLSDIRFPSPSLDGVWMVLYGYTTFRLIHYGVNAAQNQKLQTCPSLGDAKMACWLAVPFSCIIVVLNVVLGSYMAAFYESCDMISTGFVRSFNELTTMYVMDMLGGTPFPGLYYSALCLANLSTLATGLISLTYVVMHEFILPITKVGTRQATILKFTRVIGVLLGIVFLELSYFYTTQYKHSRSSREFLQVISSIDLDLGVPLITVFSLGMFFPHVTTVGAFAGLFGSSLMGIYLSYMRKFTKSWEFVEFSDWCFSNCNLTVLRNRTRTHLLIRSGNETRPEIDPWAASILSRVVYVFNKIPVAGISGLIAGVLFSWCSGFKKPQELDPRLIMPVLDVLFPFYYLPERVRVIFRFGLDHKNIHLSRKDQSTVVQRASQEQSENVSRRVTGAEAKNNDKESSVKAKSETVASFVTSSSGKETLV